MRILVTGANGYLGKGVVKQLLDDGAEVIAASRRNTGIDPRADIRLCDIYTLEDPYSELGCPDVLLHMAWRDGFVHSSDAHINDLPLHFAFIRRMLQGGVKQAAVMGSMHEIGFYEGAVDEHTPCSPMSLYGIGKNTLRMLTELECGKTGAVFQWLRGYYIVSAAEDGSSIFSKIAKAAREGKKEFPFTSGQNRYDFLDYDVFCALTAHAVEQSEVGGIINICSGEPVKLADRVERFIAENHFDIALQYGMFPDRPYDSKAIWGDSAKITLIENKRR